MFAAGLVTWLAAAIIAVTMIVAIVTVTGKNGYWITANGSEYNVAIIVVALGVALIGPGAYALDTVLGL